MRPPIQLTLAAYAANSLFLMSPFHAQTASALPYLPHQLQKPLVVNAGPQTPSPPPSFSLSSLKPHSRLDSTTTTSRLQTFVALRLESVNAADVPGPQLVELPLGERFSPHGPHTLPLHPLFAQILGTRSVLTVETADGHVTKSEAATSDATGSSVVCVAYPRQDVPDARSSRFGPQHGRAALRRRWHAGVGGAFARPALAGLSSTSTSSGASYFAARSNWGSYGRGRRDRGYKDGGEGEGEDWPDVAPVWWAHRDGKVNFEDSRERWWLMGREVEGYECF